MFIMGAGGHAKEVLEVVLQQFPKEPVYFFDNTRASGGKLFDTFPILPYFPENLIKPQAFVLGVGNIQVRKQLCQLGLEAGLSWEGLRAPSARLGSFDLEIEQAVDVLDAVQISNSVRIGKGSLLNRACSLHHDVQVGDFCELAPGCQLLGGVRLDKEVFVGAGALLFPKISVGAGAVIGAGAVVRQPVPAGGTVVGNPARLL